MSLLFPSYSLIQEEFFLQTTFGKNGTMKNTAIVRSSKNPIFDSLAFYAVKNITGWRSIGDNSPLLSVIKYTASEDSRLLFTFHEYTKQELIELLNNIL